MEEREHIIELYEIYKDLLANNQRIYFENYYYEDLSLNEIGANNNVSKSYVSKIITSTVNKLNSIEEKLKVHYKESKLKELLNNIKDNNLKRKIEEILYKE